MRCDVAGGIWGRTPVGTSYSSRRELHLCVAFLGRRVHCYSELIPILKGCSDKALTCINYRATAVSPIPCGSKVPCIRWGSRSDEAIRTREGWQVGDAAQSYLKFSSTLYAALLTLSLTWKASSLYFLIHLFWVLVLFSSFMLRGIRPVNVSLFFTTSYGINICMKGWSCYC